MSDRFELAMEQAYWVALDSPDPSTQNGAVLLGWDKYLGEYYTIGAGCNDFPKGVNVEYWYAENKQDKYNRVVHAEVAAILDAAKNGMSTIDSVLVCPWAACSNCAKHIAAAGVSTLIRHKYSNSGVTTGSHWYADCQIGDDIMKEAGVSIIEIDPVSSSVELRRNGELWSVGASS